ncbi:hypothetical protein tb265_33060 [Gemmatimonadetes bacterium T265]|nr:hypothetical protein tb265_33060 [Gemmatimonadetes bacterium T265]
MFLRTRATRARVLSGVALTGLAAAAAGCNTDNAVSVTDPNNLTPGAVASAGTTASLVQGAIYQFQGGYSGFGDDAFLTSSAVITDEFYYGDTFTTRNAADSRNLQPPALGNVSDVAFARLQAARVQARRAFAQVLRFTTKSTATADSATAAQMRAIEGYAYVTLSEGWCGAVPFTIVPDVGTIDPTQLKYGSPISTTAMNDTAIARFTEALQYDPTNRLAQIGQARALLNEARFTEAAAAVAGVPMNYVFLLQHSANSASEYNPIFSLQSNGRYGVSNLEGGTTKDTTGATVLTRPDATKPILTSLSASGLPFRAIQDPRIPFEANPPQGTCFSASVNCFLDDNYPTYASAVPVASGVEARLIQAEALYQTTQYAAMLDTLNALRANAASLITTLYPQQKQTFGTTLAALPASAVVDAATARATLFAERAYWLYLTGHRQGDLRRLARGPYSLPTNQVFPSGAFFRGGTYGDDVAYPLPYNEANNPSFTAASCSTTTP